MTKPQQTWREKRLAREEASDSEEVSQDLADNGNDMEVNMVFKLPAEFRLASDEVAELALGAKPTVFQKPEKMGLHMKPLFVRGYLQG
jgi:hypothetical protein